MIGTSSFFRDESKAGEYQARQREPIGMDARSKFTAGIAYDDLRERLALAGRLGEGSAPCAGRSRLEDIGLGAAVARKARERFGWLLDGAPQS